jgi:PAS domain S-box-containing protein
MNDDRERGGDHSFANELVHESPDALIAFSPGGKVLYWSLGAQSIFGYTPRESVGRTMDELVIPAARREEALEKRAEALSKGSVAYETVRQRKDGSPLDVDVSMRVVTGEDGEARFIVARERDVTRLDGPHLHSRSAIDRRAGY